jgi:glutamate racemase
MIRAQDAGVELTTVACPGLAPVIQEGAAIDDAVVSMVAAYTAPLGAAGVDTVILGCTHFPMVARLLRRALPGVTLIDGRMEIAREVVETLERKGLRRPPGPEGVRLQRRPGGLPPARRPLPPDAARAGRGGRSRRRLIAVLECSAGPSEAPGDG